MKIKRIRRLIESLNEGEMNQLTKIIEGYIPDEWKWDDFLDFRFIETPLTVSDNIDEEQKDIFIMLENMNEEVWIEYVNALAKYGVTIEYINYDNVFEVTPSIS